MILVILSILVSIQCISIYVEHKKIKIAKIKINKFLKTDKIKTNYLKDLKMQLQMLKNPYGLNFRNYIFIKYICSTTIFTVMFFRTNNLVMSIIYFIFIFYIPNLLIYVFKKKESIIIIDDLLKITENLLLSLSSNMTFYNSIKIATSLVKYNRLKEELTLFISDYEMYNFNIEKSVDNIIGKFKSFEFSMFLDILVQGEKEGKIISNLEMFSETLELSYFKTLKYRESKRMTLVIISCILCVINIGITAVYPLFIEITTGVSNIFR